MNDTVNAGRIEVSYDLLSQWMALPEGSVVRSVHKIDSFNSFMVIVEHPDLPVVVPGELIPQVDYTVTVERIEGRFNV